MYTIHSMYTHVYIRHCTNSLQFFFILSLGTYYNCLIYCTSWKLKTNLMLTQLTRKNVSSKCESFINKKIISDFNNNSTFLFFKTKYAYMKIT